MMQLTWLGHACFVVESQGYRVVLDPYHEVEGYPDVQTTAHAVLCSHGHRDHCYREGVTLLPERESPFQVQRLSVWHDPEQGALRGENTVHILEAEGLRIAHWGDLGHTLSPEQRAEIGKCDVCLCPVGGFYTLSVEEVWEELQALQPRWIVPMHYRHAPYGLPAVEGVERFLQMAGERPITYLTGNTLTLTAETPNGIFVPQYRGM